MIEIEHSGNKIQKQRKQNGNRGGNYYGYKFDGNYFQQIVDEIPRKKRRDNKNRGFENIARNAYFFGAYPRNCNKIQNGSYRVA